MIIVLLVLFIPILAIVMDSEIAKALAQRIAKGPLPSDDRAAMERLGFLEREVERLSSDLGRLEEESQFMHRLLTERSSASDEDKPGSGEPGGIS
jgi:hypothetical protein